MPRRIGRGLIAPKLGSYRGSARVGGPVRRYRSPKNPAQESRRQRNGPDHWRDANKDRPAARREGAHRRPSGIKFLLPLRTET